MLTHTAYLQTSETEFQLPSLPCCFLLSDRVTLTPCFQVSSAPYWAPLQLGKREVESWFTLLYCYRVKVEAQLLTGSPPHTHTHSNKCSFGKSRVSLAPLLSLIISLLPDDSGRSFPHWIPLTLPWQGNWKVDRVKISSLLGLTKIWEWRTGAISPLVLVLSGEDIVKVFPVLLRPPLAQFID